MSYATLAYLRAQGVTTGQADDTRAQALLDAASAYIDDVTGWWFDARTRTLTFDGRGDEVLHLPAPVIALTSVSIDGAALDLATVLTYGAAGSPRQEMRAPRLARGSTSSTLESALNARRYPVWPEGRRNVVVVGSFGCVLVDGASPPLAIRDACARLAIRDLPLLSDATGQEDRRRGEIERESTDGHSYSLGSSLPATAGSWRRGGITGDPAIDVTLAGFRRPSRAARV